MARYSAQFRSNALKKLLPPQSKSVGEVAAELGISTATADGWRARMNNGTLQIDDGAQGANRRQLVEKLSLLLESRGLPKRNLLNGYGRMVCIRSTSRYGNKRCENWPLVFRPGSIVGILPGNKQGASLS